MAEYPIVRFNGRTRRDSLETKPIHGIWYVGKAPTNFPPDVPLVKEREFTPAFCRHHGRDCETLNGTPCKDGPNCTCWAALFVAAWNINDERNAPWFTLIEPEASTTPTMTAAKPAKE